MKNRERGPNFTEYDKEILLDIIITSYFHILENKKTDTLTIREKSRAWEEIAMKFNSATTNEPRPTFQLKTAYGNFKKKIRKQIYDERIISDQNVNDAKQNSLFNLLKQQMTPSESSLESYAYYYASDAGDDFENKIKIEVEDDEDELEDTLEETPAAINLTQQQNIPSTSDSDESNMFSKKRVVIDTGEDLSCKRPKHDLVTTKTGPELQILSLKRREDLQKLDSLRIQQECVKLKQEQEKLKFEQERVRQEQEKVKQESERTKQEIIRTKILELQLNKASLNM